MDTLFTSEFFTGNRQRLRDSVKAKGPIIVTANAQLQRGADASFSFQQDAAFWYLTGITEPEVILVMDSSGEYLMVPPREMIRQMFDGAIDTSELSRQSGITDVYDLETGWKKLSKRLKTSKQFLTPEPNPVYFEYFAMYTNPSRATLVARVQEYNPDIELVDIRKDIARLRMVKQAPELKALRQAIDITIDSIMDATTESKLASYNYEYELDAEIGYGFRRRGARGHGFDPIVASGASAATIHSLTNNGPLLPDSLVVIDVGADYGQYCADITRTYSVGGHPSSRQETIHAAVAEVQQYAFGLLKPGVFMKEFEIAIEVYMGKTLHKIGLIKDTERESIRAYYPHACSHFLGLDPHDAGDYDAPLVPGIVMTVEPGIYIPEEGIGVRIEDDVLITENGIEILSRRLPIALM